MNTDAKAANAMRTWMLIFPPATSIVASNTAGTWTPNEKKKHKATLISNPTREIEKKKNQFLLKKRLAWQCVTRTH
jgi:hypothetical protein